MKVFKNIILFLWQLPQNLVGFLLSLFCKKAILYDKKVYLWNFEKRGLSLGSFVFVSLSTTEFQVMHEYGHNKQSYYLGWLYLIIIGLPSLFWCLIHKLKPFKKINYYSFYTEKWANKLAGWKTWLADDGFTYCEPLEEKGV